MQNNSIVYAIVNCHYNVLIFSSWEKCCRFLGKEWYDYEYGLVKHKVLKNGKNGKKSWEYEYIYPKSPEEGFDMLYKMSPHKVKDLWTDLWEIFRVNIDSEISDEYEL